MSAYGRIAMFGLAMACRRRACEELALDCKVVLGHILSGTGLRIGLSGSESENGAQAQDHNRTFSSRLNQIRGWRVAVARCLRSALRGVGERK